MEEGPGGHRLQRDRRHRQGRPAWKPRPWRCRGSGASLRSSLGSGPDWPPRLQEALQTKLSSLERCILWGRVVARRAKPYPELEYNCNSRSECQQGVVRGGLGGQSQGLQWRRWADSVVRMFEAGGEDKYGHRPDLLVDFMQCNVWRPGPAGKEEDAKR